MSEDIRTRLSIDPKTDKAQKAISNLHDGIRLTADEVRQMAKAAGTAGNVLSNRLGKAHTSVKGINKDLQVMREELIGNAKAAKTLEERLQESNKRFGTVSQQVGGLGDVESSLLAGGGAIETLGGGEAIGGGARAAGEIFALAEALPRLSASLNTAKDSIIAGAKQIGIGGGIAIGVFAALAIGLSKLSAAASKAEQSTKDQVQARQELNQFLATASQEEIEERRKANERLIEANRRTARETQNEARAVEAEFNEGVFANTTRGFRAVGISLGEGAGELDGYEGSLERLGDETQALITENERLAEAINETAAIEASRTDTLLMEAQAAGAAVQAENEAIQRTAEQNQERIQQIERQRQALQAEIDILEKSGDTSDEVTQRLEELRQKIGTLGQESDIVSNVLASNRSAVKDTGNEIVNKTRQFNQQRIEIVQSGQQRIAAIERSGGQRLADIARSSTDQRKKLELDFARATQDAIENAREDRIDLLREGQDEEAQALRDHQRNLRDIQIEAQDARTEAALDNDFRRLFLEEQNLTKSLRNEIQAEEDAALERKIAQEIKFRELTIEQGRERDERLKGFQRALDDQKEQRRIQERDAQIANQRQLEEARRASNEQLQEAQRKHEAELKLLKQLTQEVEKMGRQTQRDTGRRRGDIRTQSLLNQRRKTSFGVVQSARVL